MRKAGPLLLAVLCLGGCGQDADDVCGTVPTAPAPDADDASARLSGLPFDAFIDNGYSLLLLRDPEAISELGLSAPGSITDSLLTDVSPTYVDETYALIARLRSLLDGYDAASLTPEQQETHALFTWFLDDRLAQQPFRYHDYPVNPIVTGVQNQLRLFMRDLHPLGSRGQANAYIDRLCQVDRKIGGLIEALEVREAHGVIAPRLVLEWSLGRIRTVEREAVRSSEFYRGFADRLGSVPGLDRGDRQALLDDAATVIDEVVQPAYGRLAHHVAALLGRAPTSVGAWQHPDGAAWYQNRLRHFTTTELDAAAIHALGLQELQRIHTEMRQRFDALGYPQTESLELLFGRVADDSGSVSGQAAVQAYIDVLEAAEARLAQAFNRLPQAAWTVIPIDYGGFYVAPALDGSRPGAFYASTAAAVPRFGIPTLAYHEVIPGHHLQISLSQEGCNTLFRGLEGHTGYIEGWAHYAERLAWDLGWYTGDVHGDLGRLQGEAFRAARLVVDTGIHDLGWSFDEAVDFFVDTTGHDRGFAEGQIARYSAWPGQSTAYMVGMLELLSMRSDAEARLGSAWDLPWFHDVILDGGSRPFPLLEAAVDAAITERLAAP